MESTDKPLKFRPEAESVEGPPALDQYTESLPYRCTELSSTYLQQTAVVLETSHTRDTNDYLHKLHMFKLIHTELYQLSLKQELKLAIS